MNPDREPWLGRRRIRRTLWYQPHLEAKKFLVSWRVDLIWHNIPPYIELAVNFTSLISSEERELPLSRVLDTKDGKAFPAA